MTRFQKAIRSVAMLLAAIVATSAQAAGPAKFVIHISVDGLNAEHLQAAIDAGDAPTFRRLQDEGAYTLNARTDYTHTVTIPNHLAMFTGRPVEQPDGMPETTHHGVTLNEDFKRTDTLHALGNSAVEYVASVFDVARDAGLVTGLYVSKGKFNLVDQSYDETAGADGPHGRDKISAYFYQNDEALPYSAGLHQRLLADLASEHPEYAFIHYRDTDSVGHASRWGTNAYRQAIKTVDGYLADILQLVETDPLLVGDTGVIVTTDHGGIEFNHDQSELAENYTIPIFVWGAGIGRGDLYAMNDGVRTDPGTTRPDYTVAEQPIRNGDTGNLALALLGLDAIPGSLINAKQDLRVTFPGDFNRDGHVDGSDYTIWRDTLGSTTILRADANGNGVIDQADYDLWQQYFGAPESLLRADEAVSTEASSSN